MVAVSKPRGAEAELMAVLDKMVDNFCATHTTKQIVALTKKIDRIVDRVPKRRHHGGSYEQKRNRTSSGVDRQR